MKKTLLALAVMTAAGTANAGIEIYNQDKVTVDMTGDIEVVYMNGLEDGKDMQQEIQDADLGFDVRYASSESLALGAYWEFTDSGQSTGDAYVAAYTDFGSFKVGRLCTALDDAGIGNDYQYGIGSFFSNTEMYCADEVVRYDLDKENYYVTVGVAQDKNNNIGLEEDSTYFDTRFGVRVADFDFTGLFGTGEMEATNDDGEAVIGGNTWDETLWGVEARFNGIDKLGLAIAYYNLDNDVDTTDTIALSADFQVTEVVALSGGYSMGSHDDSRLDADKWFVNAGYSVAPNAVVYAEVGGTTQDHKADGSEFKDQTGLAIGAKVEF